MNNNFLVCKNDENKFYIYDNTTGLILNVDKLFLKIMDKMINSNFLNKESIYSKLDNDIIMKYNLEYYETFIKKYKELRVPFNDHYKKKISKRSLKIHIETLGMKELIFEMTRQCNLRCKYCIYSDHYWHHKKYENSTMEIRTAHRAVDIYMSIFFKIHKYNPKRRPVFTFYGGEPLLGFRNIKNIVEYILSKYGEFKPIFNMTSNGTLLSDKVLKFISNIEDFYISVSLDGPREEHDRNRIMRDDSGSFDIIYQNLTKIRKMYPEIFPRVNLLACFDFKTNISRVAEFFENDKNLPALMRVNIVEPLFTNYYRNFSKQDRDSFLRAYSEKQSEYIENAKLNRRPSRYIELMFETSFLSVYNRFKFYHNNIFFEAFTGTCIPGDKLYVDTEGRFHICEKINGNFPIGNIYEGLNLEKVSEIIEKYNIEVLSKCKKCVISRICGSCYATFAADKTFEIPEGFCESRIKSTKETIKSLIEILIHNPKYFENKLLNVKKNSFNFNDSHCIYY